MGPDPTRGTCPYQQAKLKTPLLNSILRILDYNLHPPVLLATTCRVIARDRTGHADTGCVERSRGDALLYQV